MRRVDASEDALFIPVDVAGKKLCIGKSRIYEMCYSGLLPYVRAGRRVLIPRRAIEQLVQRVEAGELKTL